MRDALGMVLSIFFLPVLLKLDFSGILVSLLGLVRPGLPPLSNFAGPVQHCKGAILEAWRDKVSSCLCCRKGFRGGALLDIYGSLQLLTSSHVRDRDKALLRSIMVGGVWNGSFLVGFVAKLFHVGFVVRQI